MFKNYNKKEIDLNYILENPEKVNKKLTNLEKKMKTNPYEYKGGSRKNLRELEAAYL